MDTVIPISKMASAVQPSATLAAGAKARQLKAEGLQVFDFSLGEPDFPTPEHICRAAVKAMQLGHTHYTPASGLPELRQEIARWYEKTYGLNCTAEQVIVSTAPSIRFTTPWRPRSVPVTRSLSRLPIG